MSIKCRLDLNDAFLIKYKSDFIESNPKIGFCGGSGLDNYWEVQINLGALSAEEISASVAKNVFIATIEEKWGKLLGRGEIEPEDLPRPRIASFDIDFSACKTSDKVFAKVINGKSLKEEEKKN